MSEPVEGARSGDIDPTEVSDFPGVVHQAAGMVSVQLAITIQAAYCRLASHARQDGRPLEQIAAQVVARHLKGEDMRAPERRTDAAD